MQTLSKKSLIVKAVPFAIRIEGRQIPSWVIPAGRAHPLSSLSDIQHCFIEQSGYEHDKIKNVLRCDKVSTFFIMLDLCYWHGLKVGSETVNP